MAWPRGWTGAEPHKLAPCRAPAAATGPAGSQPRRGTTQLPPSALPVPTRCRALAVSLPVSLPVSRGTHLGDGAIAATGRGCIQHLPAGGGGRDGEDGFWRRKELHAPVRLLIVTAWHRGHQRHNGGGQGPEVAVLGQLVPPHKDHQWDGEQNLRVTGTICPSPHTPKGSTHPCPCSHPAPNPNCA